MKIIRNSNSLLVITDFNDSKAILSDGLLLIFVLKLSTCILLQNATFQLKARKKGVLVKERGHPFSANAETQNFPKN